LNSPIPVGAPFVCDGGIETDLLFQRGFDLPEFAAFPLLEDDKGLNELDSYYRDYAAIAMAAGSGLILASPTWRANPDWGAKIGYDSGALDRINQKAIEFLSSLRSSLEHNSTVLVSGVLGPRGDGYVAGDVPDLEEAERYHRAQIESFAQSGADVIEAFTMTSPNEAGGIVRAANSAGIPVGILFTVETDGTLPDGTDLQTAVERVDSIGEVAYFGINCAYPDHILPALNDGEWTKRIAALKPNASSKSHAELDESEELDPGDIDHLAKGVDKLRKLLPNVSVVGGCCGTDHHHIARLWGVTV
jgi:homocysteine S-methyltransferase